MQTQDQGAGGSAGAPAQPASALGLAVTVSPAGTVVCPAEKWLLTAEELRSCSRDPPHRLVGLPGPETSRLSSSAVFCGPGSPGASHQALL